MRATAVMAILGALAGAIGCGSCGGSSKLEVREGPTPFVRCLAADPPEPGQREVGDVTLEVREQGELVVGGLAAPIRVAAFAGPAPGDGSLEAAMATRRVRAPDLVVVLGDVGDDEDTARSTLEALSGLEVPVLVVAGGRDGAGALSSGFEALEDGAAARVVDARALRRVVLGAHVLLPVSGAPEGRYARGKGACGYRPDDLEDRADALGEADGERRWLIGWAAPAGAHGITEGLGGVEAGDLAMAELAEAVGARGGLFAWPRTQAGRLRGPDGETIAPGQTAERAWLVVPPVAGPAVERADGSRVVPQPTVVVLDDEGLLVEPAADATAAK